jgi:hypothetical protein
VLQIAHFDFASGLDHWPPDAKKVYIVYLRDIPGLFGQGSRSLKTTSQLLSDAAS